jgi:hypothetical protein
LVEEGFPQKISSKGKDRDRFLGDARFDRLMAGNKDEPLEGTSRSKSYMR